MENTHKLVVLLFCGCCKPVLHRLLWKIRRGWVALMLLFLVLLGNRLGWAMASKWVLASLWLLLRTLPGVSFPRKKKTSRSHMQGFVEAESEGIQLRPARVSLCQDRAKLQCLVGDQPVFSARPRHMVGPFARSSKLQVRWRQTCMSAPFLFAFSQLRRKKDLSASWWFGGSGVVSI